MNWAHVSPRNKPEIKTSDLYFNLVSVTEVQCSAVELFHLQCSATNSTIKLELDNMGLQYSEGGKPQKQK
jgi:hypothetical protein